MFRFFCHTFFLVLLVTLPLNAQQIAFPGAEGFGKYTTGGRGGSVYHVTNLNDTGAGSLRDAVSQGNRTVVFDVGGIIRISSRIVIAKNVTIAGQTAPGGGITIYGNGIALNDDSGNDIIRYIRIRMGINGDSGKDAVGISAGQNYIFDHVSISWGRDGTVDINGTGIDNITLQDCIIAQGLDTHSTGGLMQSGKASVIRTLYIDNHTRNPKGRGTQEYINNVVYNWEVAGYILGDTEGLSEANIMGNYFIKGPSTSSSPFNSATSAFHTYAKENWYDSNLNGILDGSDVPESGYGPVTFMTMPYNYPGVSYLLTPTQAYEHVVKYAGASIVRDEVDDYLIQQLTSLGTQGSIIANESENPISGGVGTVANGTTPTDTDKDGMPDTWETENNLNPNNDADQNDDADGDGFTNLEEYLDSLVPVVNFEFPADSVQPAAPSNLAAGTFSGSRIDLTWSDNADNERGFLIQYSKDKWATIDSAKIGLPDIQQYSIEDLDGSTRYEFRVAAQNGKGNSDFSNIAADTTLEANHFFLWTAVEGPGKVTLNPAGGIYAAGTQVTITAIPEEGYIFDSWTSYLSGVTNPAIVTMTTSALVTAKFDTKSTDVPMYYDFGNGPVQSGFTSITKSTGAYSVGTGYGFNSISGLDQRDRGAPDNLRRDFIVASAPYTFIIDVPNGKYSVKVIAGDNLSNAANGPMNVYAEDVKMISAMSSAGGSFSEEEFETDVTDNQLNIKFEHTNGTGNPWRINSMEINSLAAAVENTRTGTLLEFGLAQNYPNPFNPETTISYSLVRSSRVKLTVFDLLGREVALLVNQEKPAGVHYVKFNASKLVSGVYFYKLEADSKVAARKFLLMK